MSLYHAPTPPPPPPIFVFAFPSLFLITKYSWDGPLPGIIYFLFAYRAAVFQLPFWKQLFLFSIFAFSSWSPWSETAGLQLLRVGGLLGVIFLSSLCCSRFKIRVDLELTLGRPWADVGLTVYLPAGKQGHPSLCYSRPDFWWDSSKGFLGCYTHRFSEV